MMLRFALAGLAVIGTIHAGTLRKIWDFEAGAPGVYALGFSPDGKHIAAVVGPAWDKQFVLVLDAADPGANTMRFEINPMGLGGISWSPSSQQIMIGSTRLRLQDGKTCSVQDGAGLPSFVGEDRLVAQAIRPVGPLTTRIREGHSFLIFFDSDCHSAGSWDLPVEQSLLAISADRGLLFVLRDTRSTVVDASSGIVLHQLPTLGSVRVSDSGKAICGVVVRLPWEMNVSCLDVDTGNPLATTRQFKYLGLSTASHARRLVLSEYGRIPDFIEFGWALGGLKRRIVWDFGTKQEVVSWSPKSQKVPVPFRPLESQTQPCAFDISPDGEYIVEGGAGTISLYRIEP
jgi:hypothetical protein